MLEASADPTTIGAVVTALVTAIGLVTGTKLHGKMKTEKVELDETQDYPRLCREVEAIKADLAPLLEVHKVETAEAKRKQLKAEIRAEMRAEGLEQSEDDGPPASGVRQRTLPHRGPR